jgi:hypothetical protein
MIKHLKTQRPQETQERPAHLLSRSAEFSVVMYAYPGGISAKNQGEAIESNAALVNKKAVPQGSQTL